MTETDMELLGRYRRERAEDAFAELVRRHLNLVYSVALRQVASPQLAEEISQSAFTELARQSHRLAPNSLLTAWLYKVTLCLARNARRQEGRRKAREQIASEMNILNPHTVDWMPIAPILDESMQALAEADRTVLLLRYFENKSLRDVGRTLGTSDDAAQKRVSRAIERLRDLLAKRGVTVGASGLAVAISANAVQVAPVGLVSTISIATMLASSAISTSSIAATALAMTTLQKLLVTAALVAGVTTPWLIQQHAKRALQAENLALRQQVSQLNQRLIEKPRPALKASPITELPPPQRQVATIPPQQVTEPLRGTNLMTRLMRSQANGQQPRLTTAQVDSYLKENGRSAATLLAAFRASGDPSLLEAAMRDYPNDPQVCFTALFKNWFETSSGATAAASAAQRRQWLEAFKQSASQNSLPNYLSALEYFRAGQPDQAVEELNLAYAKPQFQDYSADFIQNDEEAWRAAGYSIAEAKTAASMLLVLPHLAPMKELTQDIVALANAYRQGGDEASARAALQTGLNLGQRFDGSPSQSLLTQLFGVSIQSIALRAFDPTAPYTQDGQTVQARLEELTQQRAAIRQLTAQFDAIEPKVSDSDWISYKDRWRSFGEESALRWLVAKYGEK